MRWGGTAILARFLGQVSAAFVTIPRASDIEDYPKFPASNFIDTFVGAKLKKLNVVPSALSSDEEFIRRVYLDTIAKLPTPDELQAFVENRDTNKRAAMIDELLERPEFVDLRTLRLGDMLRCHPPVARRCRDLTRPAECNPFSRMDTGQRRKEYAL